MSDVNDTLPANDHYLVSDDPPMMAMETSPDGTSTMMMSMYDDDYYEEERCSCRPKIFCCKSRKNMLIFLIGAIVLLGGLSGLAFVLADHPMIKGIAEASTKEYQQQKEAEEEAKAQQQQQNDAYFRHLRQALVREVYNGSYDPYIFLKPNSAQRLAMQWLSYEDTLHLPLPGVFVGNVTGSNVTDNANNTLADIPVIEAMSKHRWMQRYGLMTLFYENDGHLWSFGLAGNATATTTTTTSEMETLRNSTVTQPTAWSMLTGIHECDWEFIECDDQDHIVGLLLKGVTMSGTLSKEIGLLTELRHLLLSQNRLKGALPLEFYELTNLETLDLALNQFSTPIDQRIQRFRNLTLLSLSQNNFLGTLPPSFDKLTNLQHFEMASNPLLGGSVVSSMAHWLDLEYMDISETNVSGSLPSEFGRLSRLTSMGLWNVPMLSGTIPSEVGNLVAMENLVLGKRNLVGSLPSEIGRWVEMKYFSILEADLSGSIPSEIGAWTNCRSFIYQDCPEVSGTLPTELGLMSSLEIFQVFGSKLSGTIPSECGLWNNAIDLFFHLTELTGTVPEEICQLESLKDLIADCEPYSQDVPAQVECDCCTDCFKF